MIPFRLALGIFIVEVLFQYMALRELHDVTTMSSAEGLVFVDCLHIGCDS